MAYTTSGNSGLLWVGVGVAVGMPVRTAATVWTALGTNYSVKQVVGRERPAVPGDEPLIHLPSSSSFPSGHAAMSAAAAVLLCQRRPALAPLWITMAVVMAGSRVYVRAHHPSDVVAGAVLGTAVGGLSLAVP